MNLDVQKPFKPNSMNQFYFPSLRHSANLFMNHVLLPARVGWLTGLLFLFTIPVWAQDYAFRLQFGYEINNSPRFRNPMDVAVDGSGNVYIADTYSHRVVKLNPDGTLNSTFGNYGTADGQFSTPQGIALDGSGNVYVTDFYNNRIQKFSSDGTFLTKFGSNGTADGQFKNPTGIAVDAGGNVYVADTYNHRIQKFTAQGVFLDAFGSNGTADGQFQNPYGVAVDGSGNVYVTDAQNHRIQKFTAGGTFLAKFGSFGTEDGQFKSPVGVVVDANGNVYVADLENNRIQKFSSEGTFLAKFGSIGAADGQFQHPRGIAIDAHGNVYAADFENHRIQKFTAGGTFLAKFGSNGTADGQLNTPQRVAVDANGHVYVVDTGNHRIQKFTAQGVFLAAFGSYGTDDGQFKSPVGVAVDAHGNVYIADTGNHRIQKFTADGTFLAAFGMYGTPGRTNAGDGRFQHPRGVAVDAHGNVYVADTGNDRIQKFTAGGTFLAKFGSTGTADGQFEIPDGVAVDGSGNVYVAEYGNNRIQKFSSSGAFQAKFGGYGTDDGQFNGCSGVTVDGNGNVYATDYYNDRVQKFSAEGAFLAKFGSFGTDEGQLHNPTGVAADGNGNVFVADAQNHRIQKFSPEDRCTSPVVAFAAPAVCAGTAASFANTSTNVAADATYEWDIDNNGTVDYTTKGNITHTYATAGTYVAKLTIKQRTCEASTTVNVMVNTRPAAILSGDATTCSGNSTYLSVALTGTGPWSVTYTDGTTPATVSNIATSPYSIQVSPTSNKTYLLTSVSDANCMGTVSGSATVTVNTTAVPVPQVAALADVAGACLVKITAAPKADDPCAGVLTATTTDPLEYTKQGTYTITWTYSNGNGNSVTQTQQVIVKDVTAPVPAVATLAVAQGECSVTVTAPKANDNCAGLITATTADPTTYTAQGSFVITWQYNDGHGNVTRQQQTVVVQDVTNPSITPPGSFTVANDAALCGRALTSIALGTPVTADNCAIQRVTHNAPASFPAGTTTVLWTVEDAVGNTSTATQLVTVTNTKPTLGVITGLPAEPKPVGTAIPATVTFTDNNLTSAIWTWDDGSTSAGTISGNTISGSRTYTTPGVYTVSIRVEDACGETATASFQYVVIYDPNGGFATGRGWIPSPASANYRYMRVGGKANFGFVSKYQKGATVPTGKTGFQFQAGNLSFESTAYDWLIIAGAKAQYKGVGMINGMSGYGFMLTALDGQLKGADKLRIKIWEIASGITVYDNQPGAPDDATPTTVIGGGAVVIVTSKNARESAESKPEMALSQPLLKGFPNPFSDKATIAFTIDHDADYALDVYDLKGMHIKRLKEGKAEAGKSNQVVWEARQSPIGVYLIRLTTQGGVQHIKLFLR